ncbi:MAG: AAA family ATPase [Candidatus Buchananbacteria bacterium]|nr:AAA family ATPase [Candidatus Buchananbacteria bacterium]
MFLEKLEIHGFKSFAQKTVLEFPEKVKNSYSITGIVGPNGSGKSNVADAIRWVLGEQSIKTLRGKKSQDVIFSGSDKKARLGYAEVSLYLNNQDKQADIDYSELIITRRVYQSGEGEYFINKNKARLTDIQMLLAKANFGQRTYSIIGQGMADSVLSASLAERKELFDEAVGVKQFQIKREQALNKFKATRENLAQTELTLQEIEPRLKSLTRQVKKLEKRGEIEKELKELQTDYYAQIWQNSAERLQKINKQKNVSEKSYKKLNQEINQIQSKINELAIESSRQSQFNKIQTEYNELIEQKNNLLREQAILKAKLDMEYTKQGQGNLIWLNNRAEEINKQIKDLKEQINATNNIIKQEETKLKTKQQNLESLEQRLTNVKEELNKLQKTSPLPFEQEKELETIFNQQQELVNQLLKAEKIEDLETIKNQARDISQKLSLYLEKLKTSQKQDSNNLFDLQNQLEDLSQEKNELSLEINQINLTLSIKQEKIDSLKQEITKLTQEQTKLNKEIELNQIEPKNKKELNTKIKSDLQEINNKLEALDKKIQKQSDKIKEFNLEEQNKKESLINLQKEAQEKQQQINQYSQEINQFNIELAKYNTKQEDLETEIKHNQIDLDTIKNHQLKQQIDEETTYQKIEQLKRQIEIIGGIDEETQDEYQEIKKRHDFLSEQSQDLEEAIKSLEKVIEELDKTIKEQFDQAFKEINKEFQKYFKILFNGGQAELIKVSANEVKKEESSAAEASEDEEIEKGVLAQADKFAKKIKQKEKDSYAGIEIKATPPGKKIKSINMLSGGERALTAIALICAIIYNNPAPFIVLDEVDAALDEANSERFNHILEELAKKTQFVVITHNRVTMHYAHVLYGITMGADGISKLLSVKLADAEDMVGQT